MSPPLQTVENMALQLSPEEREILAEHLITSLDSTPLTEIDQAWIKEAEKRYEELKRGQVQGIEGYHFMDEMWRERAKKK